MKKNLPNIITLINLFLGCCAMLSVLAGHFMMAFWLFFGAGWADFLDGMVARLLNVHSPIGKELDSLADVVSFGLLPGVVYYVLLGYGLTGSLEREDILWAATPAFLVTLLSAYRLAKFNLDTRQSDSFIGLPTPSSALFAMGLLLIFHFDSFGLAAFVTQPLFLFPCILIVSGLLIAELPMFSLKFKSMRWSGNEVTFTFTVAALILLVTLKEAAPSLIIVLYILVSVIQRLAPGTKNYSE